MNNLTFLQELIARWKAKSPTFFKVISTITAIAAFITGIPELLTEFGIVLPDFLQAISNKTIAIATLVGFIISKLTVATPAATARVLEKVDEGVKPAVASACE